jgi:hypothetical protein
MDPFWRAAAPLPSQPELPDAAGSSKTSIAGARDA